MSACPLLWIRWEKLKEIKHLSIVSFSVLNYANNKLDKKKLHKEQELLVEHCFCVIFTFLL